MRLFLLSAACALVGLVARGDEGGRPLVTMDDSACVWTSDTGVEFGWWIANDGWKGRFYPKARETDRTPDGRRYRLNLRESTNVPPWAASAEATTSFAADGKGGVRIGYRLRFGAESRIADSRLVALLPGSVFDGCEIEADGRRMPLRRASTNEPATFGGSVRSVRLVRNGQCVFGLRFDVPTSVDVAREPPSWFDGHTLTVHFPKAGGRHAAGETLKLDLVLSGAQAYQAADGLRHRQAADETWIPMTPDDTILPGSACDYSALRGDLKPCGTYGRVVVRGNHFEFERRPGESLRFYGANLCNMSCYPAKDRAEALADILCRAGYNAVRLHHIDWDALLESPDATDFDSAMFDRMDYFLAKCFERGLYVTTDFYVCRRVPRKALGLPGDGRIGDELKRLVYTDRKARENFKTFIRKMMTHVNPYTGRSYCDEPGLFAIALVNEGQWFPQKTHIERLKALETEREFVADMRAFLKSIGCEVPLSNMSDGFETAAMQIVRSQNYDYVDKHTYLMHPSYPEGRRWWLPVWALLDNPLRNRYKAGALRNAVVRLYDRPFVVSEWNAVGLFRYHQAPMLFAPAFAAAQDWDGVWRFQWSSKTDNPASLSDVNVGIEPTRKWGDMQRLHSFDAPASPVMLAGEGLFAALFLRRDLAPLKTRIVQTISEKRHRAGAAYSDKSLEDQHWISAGWRAQLGTLVTEGGAPEGMSDWSWPEACGRGPADVEKLPVFEGLRVNPDDGTFAVATPRTCGVFGEGGFLSAGALAADIKLAPAAVWTIALDARPIATSRRLILVHATEMGATDREYAYSGRHMTVYDRGRTPYLFRRGVADVRLRVEKPWPLGAKWRIYALSQGGRRLRLVQYSFADDGRLVFTCDTAADRRQATYMYELVRE